MRLQDKVILVTGSTTGIGEGMVRLFAREGAKVMVHGRRKDAAQKLVAEIGERASFVIGPLEDPELEESTGWGRTRPQSPGATSRIQIQSCSTAPSPST
jgi:NAD(P)-dependent dehydrogenase (short-subunit alcohol dehydrogenase family)